MRFNKNQGAFLDQVVSRWEADGTVDSETASRLKGSYTIRPFDWRRLAMYSFIIAVLCAVIAAGAILADDYLLELIGALFSAPDSALCLIFSGLATGVFYLGLRARRRHPESVFGNEAILLVAVLLAAVAIVFLGKMLDRGSGHFSLLLLLAAVLYGVAGFYYQSKLVWIFSLLSLGSWFGAETGYLSGWGAYYLGLNYPLRFALFGAALTGASFLFQYDAKGAFLRRATYKVGLLYLFISLWILSIFGNYGDADSWWRDSRKGELLHWSVLFGLVALAAIWHGLRHDDSASRGFGLVFLFINLYTKFFEYFWNVSHKAVFFFLLAVSFWLIGSKAEALWNLEFVKKGADRDGEDGA